ncbi:MAG TPA: hypothetical protein VGR89_00895 [Puia sp.]|nr:hypothetical protein [Puia sp.]
MGTGHYTYPTKDVIADSFYAYTDSSIYASRPSPGSYDQTYMDTLDNEGRMIKGRWGSSSYDSRGNLILEGITYDDKINPLRTNPVWMFLFDNYSMNNPYLVYAINNIKLEYNSVGLPTGIWWPVYWTYPSFFGLGYMNGVRIVYGCDAGDL